MGFKIQDGTGSSREAKVNQDNRLSTSAVTESEADFATEIGTRFNINTGTINLTDANNTTVLYIKNNEDSPLIITALIYNLGNSTGGSGDLTVEVVRNPTAGDIITNANNVSILQNQNHGTTRTLSVDAYKGATSEALITDGSTSISTLSSSGTGRIVISLGALDLPKGSSLAVNITPQSGNTSQGVQVAAACYVKNFDI